AGSAVRSRSCRSGLGERAVKIGPAVAEEAPGGAVAGHEVEVETGHGEALVVGTEVGDQIAAMVADEARAVEALAAAGIVVPGLEPGAVGAGDRDDVGDRVTLHGAPPGQGGVEAGIVRLGA